ncbi:uncharacterized protein LOC117658602 [Pantherophis guttatus]|uniref:Uncharacterized protein LOC117658602 n=1 Tax=Pantherophis guttatus TaxID=94885 RepID=A0ABM3ZGZ5_PANGU|nr:uncharacterized protein LOC117658602 [Pantherophis guttatus]
MYCAAPELDALLNLPVVDEPVASLVSPSVLAGDVGDGLKAEDKRTELSYRKTHQAAAWAIRAATFGLNLRSGDLVSPRTTTQHQLIRAPGGAPSVDNFTSLIRNKHVLILTDNMTTKAHLNRQGGMRSKELMAETDLLMSWAKQHLHSIKAEHISGKSNLQADYLSRDRLDPLEWRLSPQLFQEIANRFGMPVVDLFATSQNTHLPRYFTRFPSPGAEGHDALRAQWPEGLLYAFPPIPVIPGVIRKLLLEHTDLLLVAPYWPRRAWFADFQDLLVGMPWRIPLNQLSLSQGAVQHPDPGWLR